MPFQSMRMSVKLGFTSIETDTSSVRVPGMAGCGIWHFFAVIFWIWVENRGGKRELKL